MSQVRLTVTPATTVGEVASLMAERRVGSALVMSDQRLVGIFTERDIVKALSKDASATQQPIENWMSHNPQTISPDAPIEDAVKYMLEGAFRHVPVVIGEEVVGMLSMRDIFPRMSLTDY
jgi:CBS domain-containing protein